MLKAKIAFRTSKMSKVRYLTKLIEAATLPTVINHKVR